MSQTTQNTERQPKVLKLKYPFTVGEEQVTELTINRPTAKDLRTNTASNPMSASFELLCGLANVPMSTIDKMDGGDAIAALEIVGGFLQTSQPTGEAA